MGQAQGWRGDDPVLGAAANRLAGAAADEILRWAAERFAPRIVFATAFGPEGLVLLDMITTGHLRIDVFTLDTGLFFPETYSLWRRLEQRYGVRIRAVRPTLDLDEQAREHGPSLWSRDPEGCCALRKVEPLRGELRGRDAWITAIRRDQTSDRASAREIEWDEVHGLAKVNPLVSWSAREVWTYLREHDVPTNPLHERGYPSIGCWPCTGPVAAGEDPRAGRWRGRAKTECGLHVRPAGGRAPQTPPDTPTSPEARAFPDRS